MLARATTTWATDVFCRTPIDIFAAFFPAALPVALPAPPGLAGSVVWIGVVVQGVIMDDRLIAEFVRSRHRTRSICSRTLRATASARGGGMACPSCDHRLVFVLPANTQRSGKP